MYDFKIILLANLYSKRNIKIVDALFQGFSYVVFDYSRAYNELVFPLCISTYFQGEKIIVDENIDGKIEAYSESFNNTSNSKCSVTLMFVPLMFIAKCTLVNDVKNEHESVYYYFIRVNIYVDYHDYAYLSAYNRTFSRKKEI